MSSWKWFAIGTGGLSGVAGPGDDYLLYTKRGKQFLSTRPNFAFGVRSLAAPLGYVGKIQAAQWIDQSPRALGGFSNRILETISYGRYKAPQSAWDNSPRARFNRARNVQRNPSQDRWTGLQRDYASRGIVWMP